MSRNQKCPKCSSESMLYYDRNAIWICGKCRRLFSSYMDEIACDDTLFHKFLLYLACEQDALRDELINILPDPRVLVSTESDEEEEQKGQRKDLPPERRIVYQEVYLMLQAIHFARRSRIPKHILDFIDRSRDKDYVPAFDCQTQTPSYAGENGINRSVEAGEKPPKVYNGSGVESQYHEIPKEASTNGRE